MKKKTKRKQRKYFRPQYVLLLLVVLAFVAIFIGYKYIAFLQSKSFYVQPLAVRTYVTPVTIYPTPTQIVVKTLQASDYQLDTSTWQTYYDSTFDFSIKYPSSWILTPSDEKQGFYGAYGFGCEELQKDLKNPQSCNANVQNHRIVISAPGTHAPSSIYFYIYTSAAGGGAVDTKLPLNINGNSYNLDMTHYTSEENGGNGSGYATEIYDAFSITGQKSIWQKVHVHFSVLESDLPTMVSILESIKS